MPKSNTHLDLKERRAKLQEDKKKHKTWSDTEGKRVKQRQVQEIKDHITRWEDKTCPKSLVEDFQNAAVQVLQSRWINPEGSPTLSLENNEETTFGVHTKGFPVIGLRVRIFWVEWNDSFTATVVRWSTKHQSWVLKYDLWKDKVIENVPVVKWEFVQ